MVPQSQETYWSRWRGANGEGQHSAVCAPRRRRGPQALLGMASRLWRAGVYVGKESHDA